MIFEFVLFLIVGWCLFLAPPEGSTRTVLLVVYVVLMLLWLLFGITGWDIKALTK